LGLVHIIPFVNDKKTAVMDVFVLGMQFAS